jgi:hypothetical protein
MNIGRTLVGVASLKDIVLVVVPGVVAIGKATPGSGCFRLHITLFLFAYEGRRDNPEIRIYLSGLADISTP